MSGLSADVRPTTAAGVSNALSNADPDLARALRRRGVVCWQEGDLTYAQALDPRVVAAVARALTSRGYVHTAAGNVYVITGKRRVPKATPPADGRHLRAVPPVVTVRQRTPYGPCTAVGTLVRRTPKFLVTDGPRVSATKVGIHIEPCTRCPDHPDTAYRAGLLD